MWPLPSWQGIHAAAKLLMPPSAGLLSLAPASGDLELSGAEEMVRLPCTSIVKGLIWKGRQ